MLQKAKPEQGGIFSEAEWGSLLAELVLSPRQGQVIRCLFASHSDKQIALDLHISVPTVRTHLTRMFRKFDVSDREELILHIFSHFRSNC